MNRYSKHVLLIAVLFSSGVLFPVLLSGPEPLAAILKAFLLPATPLLEWPAARFSTAKDLTILNSNVFLAPMYVLVGSLVWAIPTSLIQARRTGESVSWTWTLGLGLATLLSVVSLTLWLAMPLEALLPYDSPPWAGSFWTVHFWLSLPEAIPRAMGSLVETSGDMLHGTRNLRLMSRLAHGFTEFSIGTVTAAFLSWVIYRRRKAV